MKDFTIELSPDDASKRDNELHLAWLEVNLPRNIGNPTNVVFADHGQGVFEVAAFWPSHSLYKVAVTLPSGGGTLDLLELIIDAFKKKHPWRAISSS